MPELLLGYNAFNVSAYKELLEGNVVSEEVNGDQIPYTSVWAIGA